MMRYLLKPFLASLLFISTISFAAKPTCPSVDSIRSLQFENAFNFGGWVGYGKLKNHEDEWMVEVAFSQTQHQSEEEFLKDANVKIKTARLDEPALVEENGRSICFYNQYRTDFEVYAVYPSPIPLKQYFKH